MSLPTLAVFVDELGDVVTATPVNIGWFLDPKYLPRVCRDALSQSYREHLNDEAWVQKFEWLRVYEWLIPKEWVYKATQPEHKQVFIQKILDGSFRYNGTPKIKEVRYVWNSRPPVKDPAAGTVHRTDEAVQDSRPARNWYVVD